MYNGALFTFIHMQIYTVSYLRGTKCSLSAVSRPRKLSQRNNRVSRIYLTSDGITLDLTSLSSVPLVSKITPGFLF